MDVSKTSFVRYGCLKNIFYKLWMSQKHLLYVMYVLKTSFFILYGCLKNVFCTLWMSQRCLKNIILRIKKVSTLKVCQFGERLLCVMDVSRTSQKCHMFTGRKNLYIKNQKSLKCVNLEKKQHYFVKNTDRHTE